MNSDAALQFQNCERQMGIRDKPQQKRPSGPADLFITSKIPRPTERPLKVYAFDPSMGHYVGNTMTASVHFDAVEPGPVDGRFAVIDYDATNKTFYKPIDLNDPDVLIRGGLDPSQSDPRFHQQMVYAVASETLQRFELALGRRIHWRGRPRVAGVDYAVPRGVARRLSLFPHAMCEANAFYSPEAHGILFGYFRASETEPGRNLPGQTVFTCLSHDIIAHETTHAIVDGIRDHFTEPTNIDVPAFHEAFADLAALFAHFAHKEALLDTLQKTGGQLFQFQLRPEAQAGAAPNSPVIQAQIGQPNPLVELALQFGEASGMRGGLRSALGTPPNASDIKTKTEPHDRGSILVAAMFDAYFTIYTRRTASLFRIYRAGGGSDHPTDLPGPLADRLAEVASHTAQQFFTICARALDYSPPVDINFGDFLRAVITADLDMHPSDPDGVRDALMQAFRLRGIVAVDASYFSEESLCWPKVQDEDGIPRVAGLEFGDPNGLTEDEKDTNSQVLRDYAKKNARALGFDPTSGLIDAPSFHPMFHIGEDGRLYINMVVELVQTQRVKFAGRGAGDFPMRNGVTLLIAQDPPDRGARPHPRIRFVIPKYHSAQREERLRTYYVASGRATPDPQGKKGAKGDAADDARFQIDFGLLHGGA